MPATVELQQRLRAIVLYHDLICPQIWQLDGLCFHPDPLLLERLAAMESVSSECS